MSGRLLPAQMAVAASREHVDKSTALGICSSIASATQLLQPPVGALADLRDGRYRTVWLAVGQVICAAGCIGLLAAHESARIMGTCTSTQGTACARQPVGSGTAAEVLPKAPPPCTLGE